MCNVISLCKVRKESRLCVRLKDFYHLSHKAVKYFKNPPVWWVEESEPLSTHFQRLLKCRSEDLVAELTWPSPPPSPPFSGLPVFFTGTALKCISHWCSHSNGKGEGGIRVRPSVEEHYLYRTSSRWIWKSHLRIGRKTRRAFQMLREQVLGPSECKFFSSKGPSIANSSQKKKI